MADPSSVSQAIKKGHEKLLKEFTWADFGIDASGAANSCLCPRCDNWRLMVDKEAGTWYCENCHWAGSLKRASRTAGFLAVDEAATSINRWHKVGPPRGEKTGWPDLDKHYTVKRGEWTLVTGIPGHGKSEWIDALVMNLARRDWKFGMFTPENMPYEQHVAKLLEKFVGKPFRDIFQDGLIMAEKLKPNELKLGIEWLKTRFFYLEPAEFTIESVLAQAKILVAEKKINGLVIDPWNEIEHAIPQGQSETQYTSRVLSKLRRFARFYHIHIWLVAHPAKMKKEGGKYPVPTPYDVSGSAHFRNKADNAIAVYREVDNDLDITQIHVQKIRFKIVGRVGAVNLNYHYNHGGYTDNSQMADGHPGFPIDDIKKRLGLVGDNWKWKGVGPNDEENVEVTGLLTWEETEDGWQTEIGALKAKVTKMGTGTAVTLVARVWKEETDGWEEEFSKSEEVQKILTDPKRVLKSLKVEALAWCERKVMEEQVRNEIIHTEEAQQ